VSTWDVCPPAWPIAAERNTGRHGLITGVSERLSAHGVFGDRAPAPVRFPLSLCRLPGNTLGTMTSGCARIEAVTDAPLSKLDVSGRAR
jgi:hypothetical protein